jgi:hypothetical protein
MWGTDLTRFDKEREEAIRTGFEYREHGNWVCNVKNKNVQYDEVSCTSWQTRGDTTYEYPALYRF